MQKVGDVLRDSSTKSIPLATATPHRVMRELYEQYIVYARAYANSLSNYYPQADVKLGRAEEMAFNSLLAACNAVGDGAAAARAGLVTPPGAPARVAAPQDPANPQRFVGEADKATCGEWASVNDKWDANPTVQAWDKTDNKIPVGQWTPQQKAQSEAVAPLFISLADDIERTAGRSNNPAMQDFARYAAQYLRAYAKALPTYGIHDYQLSLVAKETRALITNACSAMGA